MVVAGTLVTAMGNISVTFGVLGVVKCTVILVLACVVSAFIVTGAVIKLSTVVSLLSLVVVTFSV